VRSKEFHVHTGILESKANCSEQQRGLEVNVKYLPETLECDKASASSNGIKGREARDELFC